MGIESGFASFESYSKNQNLLAVGPGSGNLAGSAERGRANF